MGEDFERVANVGDLDQKSMKQVTVGGKPVLLAKIGGQFYAIGNVCSHVGGPLSDGNLEGTIVTCPWHGSRFDVRSGQVVGPPARTPQPAYEVKVEGSSVLVKKR